VIGKCNLFVAWERNAVEKIGRRNSRMSRKCWASNTAQKGWRGLTVLGLLAASPRVPDGLFLKAIYPYNPF
jgi:hypothetical protein